MRSCRLAAAALIAVICKSAFAGDMRSVTGIVTASDGSKVSTASVEAILIASKGSIGHLNWTPTDVEGRFHFSLEPGRYIIRAKDEADCFPDPNLLFSIDPRAKFPEVLVEQSDIAGLHVTLGTPGGVVNGELLDNVTQNPIAKGEITISDAKDPRAFVELYSDEAGHFRFVVPPRPLAISAVAPGYDKARIGEGAALNLSNCEGKKIVIGIKRE